MFGNHFYHSTIRRLIVAMGTLFNNIEVKRFLPDGTLKNTIRVPLAYSVKEKWIRRLKEDNTIDNKNHPKTKTQFPRIGYFLKSFSYDATRKTNTIQQFVSEIPIEDSSSSSSTITHRYSTFNRVPYNFDFNVFVMTDTTDDGLQIIEQILPSFAPQFTMTLRDVPSMSIKSSIPVVVGVPEYEDSWDGNYEEVRYQLWTIPFKAKGFLYNPVTETPIIRTVLVDFYEDADYTAGLERFRLTVSGNHVDFDDETTFTQVIENVPISSSSSSV